jgi:hypothetical protein
MTSPSRDLLLAQLQQQADENVEGVPVSLLVNGAVVSGILGSAEVFTEANRRGLRQLASDSGFKTEEAVEMRERFERTAVVFQNASPAETPPDYVHLTDVTVHANGMAFSLNVWRGKLSQVDGWTLGGPDQDD